MPFCGTATGVKAAGEWGAAGVERAVPDPGVPAARPAVWGVQFNPQYDPVIAEGVIRAAKTLSSHGYDIEEMVATGYREYNDLAGRLFGNFFAEVTGSPPVRITETPGPASEKFIEAR